MKSVFWSHICAAMVFFINAGCGFVDSKLSAINGAETSTTQGNETTIEIGFATQYSSEVKAFFELLHENKKIHRYTFEKATEEIGALVSNDVVFTTVQPSAGVGAGGSSRSETYKGVKIGERVLIFKKEFYPGIAERHYRPLTWFPYSVLHKDSNGFIASLEDKVRYVLDTKIYEPIRIGNLNSAIDTVDFIAHFIPGFAGAERTFVTGKTKGAKLLGIVEMIGDVATFGLGSKIRAVKQGAAAIVLTASSIRVSVAAAKAGQGTAGVTDGVDAFIATVEAGLAAVTLVKIKLGPLKHTVSSMGQAKILSKEIGRSADDIFQNGLSSAELKKLVGDIPELRRLKQGSGTADDFVEGAARANPCKAFGLTGSGLCELAKLAPAVRKSRRAGFQSRGDAFSAAKKDAGGYFGKMEEIQPLYGQKRNSSSNLGRSPLDDSRNLDNSISAREYWYKNADDQIIVIQEHSMGHHSARFIDNRSHFNVRHFKDEWKGLSEVNMRDMVRNANPPPNVPAVGHYDF
jgi:hypothetical protein